MDKIRLFNPNYDYFTLDKLHQKFFSQSRNTNDFHKNTFFDEYQNNRGITAVRCGFGMWLDVNPTKYLQGHNLKQITRLQMFDFIEQIEHDLEFSVKDCSLTKFDYNNDIYTHYPVTDYMPIFRETHNYPKEKEYKESITYSNGSKKLIIYDKVAEALNNGIKNYSSIQGNHMRIELAATKINTKKIKHINTLHDLLDKDNYINVIHEWKTIYDKINKQSILKATNDFIMPNHLNILDLQQLCLINSIGLDNYLTKLQQDYKAKRIGYDKQRSTKQKAIELHQEYIIADRKDEDLLHELNRKVDCAFQQAIQTA